MTNLPAPFHAPLAILAVLHGVMLASLYSGVPPHPPVATPLFAICPFIGAVLALIAAAVFVRDPRVQLGVTATIVVLSLISFGPQKYLDPAFPMIWPAVLTGQLATVALGAALVLELLGKPERT